MTQSDTAISAVSAVRFRQALAEVGSTRTGARPRAREDSAVSDARQTATERDRRAGVLARLVWELTPPHPWQHRPASLAAMWRYASRGGWTGPEGLARRAGVWWYRLIALPVCLVTHYTAWLVARPSRAVTAVVVMLIARQALR